MRKNEARWNEKEQRWKINVQDDGERKTFNDSTPGRKGKIACEKKADKWLEERLVGENIRVEVMLDRFYERIKKTTSYGYYGQYEKYIRLYIKPIIGMKRVSHLTQNDLQSVIDTAYSSPASAVHTRKKNNEPDKPKGKEAAPKKKLSYKTLTNISGCLMAFMKYCRNANATTFMPETLSIPNQAQKSKKSVATKNDIQILFSKTTTLLYGKEVEDLYIYAYRFSVLCGMRPGERTALKNSDIIGNKVTISESINDEEEVTPGKNENAQRTYTLDYHAMKVLDDQREMLKRLGWITPYVFPDYDLSYIPQDKFRKHWKRYCKSNGIGETTPYELRHTWVSVNKKMPDGLKKLVVGHSKDMDTDGQYGHEMEGDMDEAAEYTGEAFKKILGW